MIQVITNLPSWIDNRSGDAATLAAEANTPASIRHMELKTFFGAIIGAADEADRGTVAGELRPLMKEKATVDMVVSSITNGDLVGLQAILMLLSGDFAAPTQAAINAVVEANTITAGALNWNEDDGECPAEFTAEWVTATLTEAGYTWTGTTWARA